MFGPWGWKWKVGVPKNAEIRTILYRVSVDHQSLVVLLPGTVLSRTKPRKPPMNICVVKNMWSTWSNSLTPVITCHGQVKKKKKHSVPLVVYCTCLNKTRILHDPVGDDQCREYWKAKDEYVPRGIHVCGLKNDIFEHTCFISCLEDGFQYDAADCSPAG